MNSITKVVRADVVEWQNIGMVEGCDGAGLALEALVKACLEVFTATTRSSRAVRAPYRLHPSRPSQLRKDFEGAERAPGVRGI